MGLRRRDVVTLYDITARPRVLPLVWRVGSLFDRAKSYGIRGPGDLQDTLNHHIDTRGPIKALSLWGHGKRNGVQLNGKVLEPEVIVRLVPRLDNHLEWVWLRSCDVFRNHDLAERWASAMGCAVYGHCEVISGNGQPWKQGSVVGLLPGQKAAWDPTGKGLPSSSATRMRPKPEWLQDPRLLSA